MAKQTGLGDNCYIADVDVSGDIGSLSSIHNARTTTDATGINKSGMERLSLAKDGSIDFAAWFNPANAHLEISTLPRANTLVSYFRGTTIGNIAASMVAKQVNYDGSRAADGALSFAMQALSDGYGLEWGRMLTAGVVLDQDLGALTSYDYGAAVGTTAFGLQAYLHVFAIGSGTAQVSVQHSSDNAVGDPFADVAGAVFTDVSAAGWERIQTARDASVERYLRVNVDGTFTDLDFAVMVVKNRSEVVF